MRYRYIFGLLVVIFILMTFPSVVEAAVIITDLKEYSIHYAGDNLVFQFKDDAVVCGQSAHYNVAINYRNLSGTKNYWVTYQNKAISKPKKEWYTNWISDKDFTMCATVKLKEGNYGAPASVKIKNLKTNAYDSIDIIVKSKKANDYVLTYNFDQYGTGKVFKTYKIHFIVPLDTLDENSDKINGFNRMAEVLGADLEYHEVSLNGKKKEAYSQEIEKFAKSIDNLANKTDTSRTVLEVAFPWLGKVNTVLSANNFILTCFDSASNDNVQKVLELMLYDPKIAVNKGPAPYQGSIYDWLNDVGADIGISGLILGSGGSPVQVEKWPGSGQYGSLSEALNTNRELGLIKSGMGLIPMYDAESFFLGLAEK